MDEDLRRLIEKTAEETRRHFEVAAEGLRQDVRFAIEGVAAHGEKLDRLAAELREEFVEVRSMIRFSYAELDRRLRSLEDVVSSLQSRVDRLESSPTH